MIGAAFLCLFNEDLAGRVRIANLCGHAHIETQGRGSPEILARRSSARGRELG
jgi:hypothetical protein